MAFADTLKTKDFTIIAEMETPKGVDISEFVENANHIHDLHVWVVTFTGTVILDKKLRTEQQLKKVDLFVELFRINLIDILTIRYYCLFGKYYSVLNMVFLGG